MKTKKKTRIPVCLFCFLLTCFFILSPIPGNAEEKYPARPIKFIVPFSAGGPTDVMCRKMCDLVQKSLGVEIVVENKSGGGGLLGASFLAKSKPDGYTIGMIGASPFTTMPNFQKLDFDPMTAFTPIIQFASSNETLQVSTNSSIKTLEDFIKEGRKRQITAGTSGIMTHAHIAMQRLATLAKINLKLVPFGGSIESLTAVLGDQLDAGVLGGSLEYVRAGKMRVITRLNSEAKGLFKDIPSLKELGYDVDIITVFGVFGPKGLPENIKKKLEEGFTKAARDPFVVETIETIGNNSIYRNSQDYEVFLKEIYQQSTKEIKELGLGIWAPEKK